ncbi:hypothetical protein BX616_000542 [Lobosporangium transversale]|nr:hypothetical protein BX616_000542 [Lobosporangium transversale]
MAEKARERAFLRMLEHAAAAGGNAVIGVQFTGQEIIQLIKTNGHFYQTHDMIGVKFKAMTEVMAYGTAVTLVPAQQVVPQQAMSPQPIYNASPYSQPASPYSQAPLQQPTGSIQVQQQPFSPPKN